MTSSRPLRITAALVGVVVALVLAWVLGRATRPAAGSVAAGASTTPAAGLGTPGATGATPATSGATPSAAAPTPSSTPRSAVDPGTKTDFGYARSARTVSGYVHLSFDRAILYTGQAANDYAAKHGMATPVPNDYVLVNDSKKLRDLVLAPDASITGNVRLTGSSNPSPVTLAAFLAKIKADPGIPLNITYDSQLLVTGIAEQFFP